MSQPEHLIVTTTDQLCQIRFKRPHRLNAVVEELYTELLAALAQAEADPEVRVVLLTGEGRAFCVGADLKAHQAGRTPFARRQYLRLEQQVCERIFHLAKPVVAAVNGYALGAGAEMAVASDFIVIAESAQIGFPEVTIGNFLGGGVTWLLPRLVGLAKARELLFFGERIDGREAARIGLAARVFPDATFREAARAFARQLAQRAPFSLQLVKEQLNHAGERTFDACLTAELEGMTFVATTQDWQEGIDAFAEKRAPRFQGK